MYTKTQLSHVHMHACTEMLKFQLTINFSLKQLSVHPNIHVMSNVVYVLHSLSHPIFKPGRCIYGRCGDQIAIRTVLAN